MRAKTWCTIKGCVESHHARGLCRWHYTHLHVNNRIGADRVVSFDPDDDFWEVVDTCRKERFPYPQ